MTTNRNYEFSIEIEVHDSDLLIAAAKRQVVENGGGGFYIQNDKDALRVLLDSGEMPDGCTIVTSHVTDLD